MNVEIIELDYIELPLTVALDVQYQVYGYDPNTSRVAQINNYIDKNEDVTSTELLSALGKKPSTEIIFFTWSIRSVTTTILINIFGSFLRPMTNLRK